MFSDYRERATGRAPLGGALLGALVLVDVEDEAVVGGAADPELERGALLELAQQLDRLVEAHREGRAAPEKRSTEISEVAPIWPTASSKPTSWEKSPSGPISTSTRPSKSASAAALDVAGPSAVEPVRRPRRSSASVSSCARRPTSTASRSAFIRIRVAWPRAWASISSRRAGPPQRVDAAVVALVGLAQLLAAGRGSRARARSPSPESEESSSSALARAVCGLAPAFQRLLGLALERPASGRRAPRSPRPLRAAVAEEAS